MQRERRREYFVGDSDSRQQTADSRAGREASSGLWRSHGGPIEVWRIPRSEPDPCQASGTAKVLNHARSPTMKTHNNGLRLPPPLSCSPPHLCSRLVDCPPHWTRRLLAHPSHAALHTLLARRNGRPFRPPGALHGRQRPLGPVAGSLRARRRRAARRGQRAETASLQKQP
jgi:hypothetical protein